MSLRRITESFQVTHNKLEINYAKIKKVTPKLLKYLEHDCRGLYESIEKFYQDEIIQKAGPKYTIASQAIQVLRTFLKHPIPACPRHYDARIRLGYAGGRTEIFRPLYPQSESPIRCFDFNSLYPSVMDTNEIPTEFMGVFKTGDAAHTGFMDCTVSVPDCYIPPLWVKELEDGTKKFIFPTGRVSGVYPTCEIRRALEVGCRIEKIHRFYRFKNGGPIFRDFIRSVYEVRRRSRDPVSNTIAKLILNSSYGRMAIGISKESIVFDDGREGITPFRELRLAGKTIRLAKEEKPYNAFSNVAIGAWITGLARVKLFDALLEAERLGGAYYCDTDSVFTPARLPTGSELGELKHEGDFHSACFLLPKTYIADSQVKMKGFDKKKIQHFQYDDFFNALKGDFEALKISEEPRMNRFKSALQAGKLLSMGKRRTKQVRSLYDKRILFQKSDGSWDSRPHHLK